MAHFQMSTGGSKSNEHVDHFLVDIHKIDLKASPTAMLDDDFLKDVWNRQRRTALIPIKVQIQINIL